MSKSKAADGQGTLTRVVMSNGTVKWRMQITERDRNGVATGKRPQRTFSTQKDAFAWRDKMAREYTSGNGARTKTVTVPQVVERWLREASDDKAASTMISYWSSYNLHIPTKLDIRVSQLTEARVRQFVREVGASSTKGDGRASAKRAFDNLRAAMKWAARADVAMINTNPMAGIPFQYGTKEKHRKAMPVADYWAILDGCAGEPSQLIWRILIETGARRGEILGLNVGDVDFRQGTIDVWKISTPESHGKLTRAGTKGKGERGIHLSPELLTDLKPLTAGRKSSEPLFLGPQDGQRLAFGTYGRWWHRDMAAAGVSGYVPHQLRHTFATAALEAGVPVKVVSEILGHSSVVTTLNIYADATDAAMKSAITLVGSLVSRPVANSVANKSTTIPSAESEDVA